MMGTVVDTRRESATAEGVDPVPPGPSRTLPRVSLVTWTDTNERLRDARVPVVIACGLSGKPSVERWTLAALRRRFPQHRVRVVAGLPASGVPYTLDAVPHEIEVDFAELVDRIWRGERCYLNQAPLDQFDGLVDEIDLRHFVTPPLFAVNLWVGNDTRSGLHFDGADNVLVQVHGNKHFVLVSPGDSRHLPVFSDTPSKSSIDPEDEHWIRSWGGRRVTRWIGELHPGDVLFIPRGWWHYLASPGPSVSVNVWHGAHIGTRGELAMVVRSGIKPVIRTGWDFVWSGVLGRPYSQRLFSPPPLGVDLHSRRRSHRKDR